MTRPPGRWLLIFSSAAIAVATLPPGGGTTASRGCVLCGERGLSDFLANILLFAPLGYALARRGRPLLHAAVIGAVLSLAIELAQLVLITGRDANFGDLIANTCGAATGWAVGRNRHWWLRPTGHDATRCIGITVAALVLLLGGLGLFTPSLPRTHYYMQWTARFGHMAPYEGRVLSTRLGPLEIPGSQRIAQTDSVRRLLFREPLEITAVAAAPRAIAPIVSIHDGQEREILMLAADRADLIYRYRMLADELRLDHGSLRVHQAFERTPPGTTFRLTWRVDTKGFCLELEGRSECGPGFTVGDTWSLLVALDRGTDERAILQWLWVWLMFLPAGLSAVRWRTVAAVSVGVGAALSAVPPLLGFSVTPPGQIIAAGLGLVAGQLLSTRRVRRTGARPPASSSSDSTSPTSGETDNWTAGRRCALTRDEGRHSAG